MPTFGLTTSAGSFNADTVANDANLSKATLSEAGSVTKITAYLRGTGNVKGLIYDDDGSGSAPGTLLGVTGAAAIANGSGEWLDLTFSSPVALTASTYYLAVVVDADIDVMSESLGGGRMLLQGDNNYASPTNPFVYSGGDFSDFALSMYATYTVAEAKPIWLLDALTTPALVDLLVAVDDPSGTPITKKLALSDLLTTLAISNVVVQVKTVGSGTYTPTAGMKKVLGIAVGGGGGGAGGINTDSAGGGGGGGGAVIRLMTAAQIGASKAYVVGAGGAATSAGAATTLDTAGALLNAGGGGAGTAGATFSVVGVTTAGGAGGTAANGDLNIPGQPGGRGVIFSATIGRGGTGGRSLLGLGGPEGGTDAVGVAAGQYGGGGSGGHAAAAADRAGGAGADGILYLIQFLAA